MNNQDYAEWRKARATGPDWKHFLMTMEWIEKLDPKSVFDYGCGEGFYVHCFNYYDVPCIGFDPNPELIKNAYMLAKGRIDNKIVSLQKPVELVICIDVLEHLTETDANAVINAMSTMTGKWLLLSICDVSLWDKYPDPTHINCKSREFWEHQFTSRGFKKVEVPETWLYHDQLYLFEKVSK